MDQRTSVTLVVNGIPRTPRRRTALEAAGPAPRGPRPDRHQGRLRRRDVRDLRRHGRRKPVRACRTPASKVAGQDVLTIEGLGTAERPHALQEAFAAADAVQCGFCTPGMIMAPRPCSSATPGPAGARSSAGWAATSAAARATAASWTRSSGRPTGKQGRRAAGRPVRSRAARRGPRSQPGTSAWTLWTRRPGRPSTRPTSRSTGCCMRGRFGARTHTPTSCDRHRARQPRARRRGHPDRAGRPRANSYGRKMKDQPVLADDRVRQLGDPVALVVATSPEAAAAALSMIEVEYRQLPALSAPDEALEDGAPPIHPGGNLLAEHWLRSGDIEDGFARADVVVEKPTRPRGTSTPTLSRRLPWPPGRAIRSSFGPRRSSRTTTGRRSRGRWVCRSSESASTPRSSGVRSAARRRSPASAWRRWRHTGRAGR